MDGEINKFDELRKELIKHLESLDSNELYKNLGDLGDMGNEIGTILGKYIMPDLDDNSKYGWEEDDFKHGIRHGVSLIDGTHG